MINVKNLYKDFGTNRVIDALSCDIKDSECVVVIGPSGSGKSTFLRCLNELEEPTFGEIWLDGSLLTPVDPYLHREVIKSSATFKKLIAKGITADDAIKKIKKEDLLKKHEGSEYSSLMKDLYNKNHLDINLARQKMGMVFQHFNLFNNLTVMNNLTLAPIKLKLKSKEEAEAKALELLDRIALGEGVSPVFYMGKDGKEKVLNGVYVLHGKNGYELRKKTPYVNSLLAGDRNSPSMSGCIGRV